MSVLKQLTFRRETVTKQAEGARQGSLEVRQTLCSQGVQGSVENGSEVSVGGGTAKARQKPRHGLPASPSPSEARAAFVREASLPAPGLGVAELSALLFVPGAHPPVGLSCTPGAVKKQTMGPWASERQKALSPRDTLGEGGAPLEVPLLAKPAV